MPMSATQRVRKHRDLKRAKVGRFTLELPLVQLGATLVAAGWLATEDRDDVNRVHGALEQALREWCGADEVTR